MTAYLPSKVTLFEVRFLRVIQYVTCVAFARSTATSQSIWGAPTCGEVGIMYQTTCHGAGQLKVNQRRCSLAARLPVHCTPHTGCVIHPSTGISQTPRLRVPARSTRACGWYTRSPTYIFGRPFEKSAQVAPPSVLWYTPRSAPTHTRLPFRGSTSIAFMG